MLFQKIVSGQDIENPVFQILSTARVKATNEVSDRLRLIISDGLMTHSFAMFNIASNEQYEPSDFSDYTIIRALRYVCSTINRSDNNER